MTKTTKRVVIGTIIGGLFFYGPFFYLMGQSPDVALAIFFMIIGNNLSNDVNKVIERTRK